MSNMDNRWCFLLLFTASKLDLLFIHILCHMVFVIHLLSRNVDNVYYIIVISTFINCKLSLLYRILDFRIWCLALSIFNSIHIVYQYWCLIGLHMIFSSWQDTLDIIWLKYTYNLHNQTIWDWFGETFFLFLSPVGPLLVLYVEFRDLKFWVETCLAKKSARIICLKAFSWTQL